MYALREINFYFRRRPGTPEEFRAQAIRNFEVKPRRACASKKKDRESDKQISTATKMKITDYDK